MRTTSNFAKGDVSVLKKEKYSLHLKVLDKIKVFDVEMEFDEDTEIDRFSTLIDGEKIELTGNTESIFMELSKILKDKYKIHSCYTCRFGNFSPFGDQDNEIFCIDDFEPKSKSDLFFLYEDAEERKKRCRTLFEVCEKFQPCSDDYWTYK